MQNYSHPCYIYTTFLEEKGTKQFWERIRQWSLHFHAELFRNKNTSKCYNYTQHSWERKEQNCFWRERESLNAEWSFHFHAELLRHKNTSLCYIYTTFLREKVGSVVTTEPQRKTSHAHWSRQVLSALSCLLKHEMKVYCNSTHNCI